MTGIAVRMTFQVVLVLRLGLPEVAGGDHFGHHLARPKSRRLDTGVGLVCGPPLLFARVEDGRTIAGSDVVALAVQRGRIMNLEEELQNLPIADRPARRSEEHPTELQSLMRQSYAAFC